MYTSFVLQKNVHFCKGNQSINIFSFSSTSAHVGRWEYISISGSQLREIFAARGHWQYMEAFLMMKIRSGVLEAKEAVKYPTGSRTTPPPKQLVISPKISIVSVLKNPDLEKKKKSKNQKNAEYALTF